MPFGSKAFYKFAKEWDFEITTSITQKLTVSQKKELE